MRLISLKTKLKNTTNLLKTLKDVGLSFGEAYYQHDRVFLPRGYKEGSGLPRMIIRTYVPDGKEADYKLIVKRHSGGKGADVVHSTLVMDYTETVHMLHQLGFSHAGDVAKHRQELDMERGIALYLDKVDGLGTFLKLESQVGKDDGVEDVQADLSQILQAMDIKEDDIFAESYRSLLMTKKK
ncbi:MAG: CYTH domain-containing protein [Candidatus Nomurabacteria bacterium]|jgi:predicted adenylyl cyclase CyaB|nr:CYTH domain-containing protein [Candidatus Nomurabacteria bacterium]